MDFKLEWVAYNGNGSIDGNGLLEIDTRLFDASIKTFTSEFREGAIKTIKGAYPQLSDSFIVFVMVLAYE
jgi:hypothetical protein